MGFGNHHQTMKLDFNSSLKSQILSKYRNDLKSDVPNSARNENNQQPVEMNKKLLLSGFFEDDFPGEIQNTKEDNDE